MSEHHRGLRGGAAGSASEDGIAWRHSDRRAFGVNLTRDNQHGVDTPIGLYLGLLLRALTGGLVPGSKPEPLAFPRTGLRSSFININDSSPLIWDGYQRGIETGRVLERVLDARVPGAVVEVGVYRGGMIAYLQGILLARHSEREPIGKRQLWLVDSFKGLPNVGGMVSQKAKHSSKWNSAYKQKQWAGDLSVGQRQVFAMMERHRLLEAGNVHALSGYVNETLPRWPPSRRIALLRIDVDIYSATYDTLHHLYPRLSVGGAVVFDDDKFVYAHAAMADYRERHNITARIRYLPGTTDPMAYWFKCGGPRRSERPGPRLPDTCS